MNHSRSEIPGLSTLQLDNILMRRVSETPKATAFCWFCPKKQELQSITWFDLYRRVAQCRNALYVNHSSDDRIALLMRDRIEWVLVEQAALASGIVYTSIPANAPYTYQVHILNDCKPKTVFTDEGLSDLELGRLKSRFPEIKFVSLDPRSKSADAFFSDWLLVAKDTKLSGDNLSGRNKHDHFSVVYTSGTTGYPKAVLISQQHLVSNLAAVQETKPAFAHDRFLCVGGLSHIMERAVSYYLPMSVGASTMIVNSEENLLSSLRLFRPTVIVANPAFYQKLFDQLNMGRGEKGLQNRLRLTNTPSSVRTKTGGQLRILISGGAPMNRSLATEMRRSGLPIIEGYGLTEIGPVVALNDGTGPSESVGKILPGFSWNIDSNGALLLKTENMWSPYAVHTNELSNGDYFQTKDKVRYSNGYLYIEGRMDEILRLDTGEKIHPASIESDIVQDPLFDEAVIVGDGRQCLVALVSLNSDAVKQYVIEHPNTSQLSQEFLLTRINLALKKHAHIAKIAGVVVADTDTSKIRTSSGVLIRKQFLTANQEKIDDLYLRLKQQSLTTV